ncbi:hypothetical protein METBIDRAFT_206803 [Metschnikowia bicuspidata var. bicuspidata NRRL YB-4993]|uniref:Uncharacterized protein n=1 Tax=Metschnikowia bicuspidata var. bicuspidata NRRL YB-4993 TaxID=869754 RepID=A0A1A0H6L4_9ASCO|nr:hypothetical protein METBIDRAFT_206803 [Metschnikowia bicuspidata var. bicuspidata NRRL YB-4993]OBA19729.1 hypothetical protein METBIDRAFT_206803 [Metschnikowia bicuspidata var. bicuspidata NRRL YB-4993]
MIKSESRKSSLFSSLKTRRSLKDMSVRAQKSSLVISGPFPQPTPEARATPEPAHALSPLDPNAAVGKRYSQVYFAGPEGQENTQKRHSLAWQKHAAGLASELSLATLSAVPSDMASVDSALVDLPLPTIMEHDRRAPSLDLVGAAGLWRSAGSRGMGLGETCAPRRIHRTTNIGDMRKFIDGADMLPMSNRRSLEVEAHEIQTLGARACRRDFGVQCAVRLVENAFVMTFSAAGRGGPRDWDDVDEAEVLKGDADDDAADLLPVADV